MQLTSALALIGAWICVTLPQTARALTTNLIADADTTIHGAFPNNNFGGGATFTSGVRNQGGRSRALLYFNVGARIPAGAIIHSAELTLTVNNVNGPNSTFDLNRVLAQWGEGQGSDFSAGSPGGDGEATWNDRLGAGTPWATAGGDFTATASASQDIAGVASYTFSAAALTADVQLWVDNSGTNFGWILLSRAEDTLGTIRRFASRLDEINPPVLIIDYSLPETLAMPPVLTNAMRSGNQFQFSFAAESNRTYAVEFLGSLSETNWSGLTNIPALPENASHVISDSLTGSNRFYRVRTP